jgi:hypothetical protein
MNLHFRGFKSHPFWVSHWDTPNPIESQEKHHGWFFFTYYVLFSDTPQHLMKLVTTVYTCVFKE